MFDNNKMYRIKCLETGEELWVHFERELDAQMKTLFISSVNEKLDEKESDDLTEDVERALDIILKRYDILGYILPNPAFNTIYV